MIWLEHNYIADPGAASRFDKILAVFDIHVILTCLLCAWYNVVVVVNHCFTSLFGTKSLLSDNVIR